ncbi:YkvA family protein [Antarcticirhabdus aurantiaca]|uniref:YkvA family protein n=1 Tax=Antarcticirhabdus aurantiaca TaxID=2606717 RepID=A0ACD4NQW6_9HYPH|nr:YkvA family protein [Antarcticirhabdus aurantiaca]WAJ29087.1 YkvA family protein [Jeongeuplla avenae]
MLTRIKTWARALKRDVVALWIAARDPRTPWRAKLAAGAVAAYALSPIDLIPDFIPILGYLDEIILLPLAIALIVRMIPPDLMREYRAAAAARDRPASRAGMIAIVLIWMALAAALAWWLWPAVASPLEPVS